MSRWVASNRLKLSPSKSKFLWCTTLRRHPLGLLDYITFAFGVEVRPFDTIRNLGIHFDSSQMTLNTIHQSFLHFGERKQALSITINHRRRLVINIGGKNLGHKYRGQKFRENIFSDKKS